jgi:hypothetical protein
MWSFGMWKRAVHIVTTRLYRFNIVYSSNQTLEGICLRLLGRRIHQREKQLEVHSSQISLVVATSEATSHPGAVIFIVTHANPRRSYRLMSIECILEVPMLSTFECPHFGTEVFFLEGRTSSWPTDWIYYLDQCSSTWGTRTPGDTIRHLRRYANMSYVVCKIVKKIICYIILDVIYLIYFRCRL